MGASRISRVRAAATVTVLAVAAGSVAWGLVGGDRSGAGRGAGELVVDIVVPPGGEPAPGDGVCASGCSLAHHPVPPFTPRQFGEALADYAGRPVDEPSESLETLLFYGARTRELIEQFGTAPLPAGHASFLRRELSRDHALIALRLVDERGVVRADYPETRVPIGVKQHLRPATTALDPIEFNGTVMRVGLSYVWSRF